MSRGPALGRTRDRGEVRLSSKTNNAGERGPSSTGTDIDIVCMLGSLLPLAVSRFRAKVERAGRGCKHRLRRRWPSTNAF